MSQIKWMAVERIYMLNFPKVSGYIRRRGDVMQSDDEECAAKNEACALTMHILSI